MNRAIKIILTGIIAGQSVFWCHKLAKADALQDGGTILAIDVLCGYQIKPVEYQKLIRDAIIETGVANADLMSKMMIVEGEKVAYRIANSEGGLPAFCHRARQFYRDRNLFKED